MLDNFTCPADIFPSNRFYAEDLLAAKNSIAHPDYPSAVER
jgi:hypothetical protein